MSEQPIIHYERLRAPAEQLGLLFEPPAGALARFPADGPTPNLDRARILDTSIGELRRSLRARLHLRDPVIVVGHQSEFYHAGVLAKLIAGDLLAEKFGSHCLYITADTDTPKAAGLVVPVEQAGELRRISVPIPGTQVFLPEEYRADLPADTWRGFFADVAARLGNTDDTFLNGYQSAFVGVASRANENSVAFVDATWRGLVAIQEALRLPVAQHARMSLLSETPEFRAFVLAIAADAGRFADAYNTALAEFRDRHQVRNPARPAPPLLLAGNRIELPFWLDQPTQARRRMFVEPAATGILVRADDERIGELPRDANVSPLDKPLLSGWHIRPRALTLSAFGRLFVGDLFIHGIGGAKYDEVTTAFVQRFWNVQPYPLACITATLRMPLPMRGVSRDDLARARWRKRDFLYNPQRYVDDLAPALREQRDALVARSDELRRQKPRDRAGRRKVFHEIQQVRRDIVNRYAASHATLQRAEQELRWQLDQDAIARDREYFFALHPRAALEALTERLRAALR